MNHNTMVHEGHGLVGLTQPILIHSSRVASCDKSLNATQCHFKAEWWRNWYTADWAFGLPVVYLFCAGIGLFTIGNVIFRIRHRKRLQNSYFPTRITALMRYLTARQFRIGSYYSPTAGPITLVCLLIVFSTAMAFGPKPYYWPSTAYGGSPPLATRTGWLSTAMLPFLITFSTKWNIITLLTGISHERLQIYHRWAAWIMYALALLHTFPFLVQNIGNGTMSAIWRTKIWYWSGVAALVPQTWLAFMSIGPIRNRYYETFKSLHFLAAAFFVPLLFVHCNFRLTSWDYFFATAALYTFSFLVRWGRTFLVNRVSIATIMALPENMTKVTIPTHLSWKPGQHFFIRFLNANVDMLSAHPFTVASIPTPDSQTNHIELYIRVREGHTARLAKNANRGSATESRVILDGPYGGLPGSLRAYDRVLLLAGGSGGSFIVPLLLDAVRQDCSSTSVRVDVIWATRSHESVVWFRDVFQEAEVQASKRGIKLSISVYLTNESRIGYPKTPSALSSPAKDEDLEAKGSKSSSCEDLELHTDSVKILGGRPDLAQIVDDASREGGSLGIASCGPESFLYDVGNSVAKVQLDIAAGRAAVREVFLHTEAFGW